MLLSQKEERGRRFSLALRAGIPVLLLVFLVLYSIIDKSDEINISIKDGILLGAITFIAIYFIYFFMNLSAQETMIDETTQGFNKKTFMKRLQEYRPNTIACLNIENLQSLNENYSSEQIDYLLYSTTQKLNLLFKQHGLSEILIGRYRGSEFLIALNNKDQNIHHMLKVMINENSYIDDMEIDYKFAVITNTKENFDKTIIQLRDLITSQSVGHIEEKNFDNTKDATELSSIEQCVIADPKK